MDAAAGAMGWGTLCTALSLGLGLVACIVIASNAPKFLERRGLGRFLPWLVFGSLLLTAGVSLTVLVRHVPDRFQFTQPDTPGPSK